MPLLGAHMSIAGGYYKAVEAAAALGMDCVQVFTKNNNQWRAKAISPGEAEKFRQALKTTGVRAPLSHASYLINLASPDDALWEKSIAAMAVELERAEMLGIPYVVVHPGSYTTSSEEEGLARIAKGLDKAIVAAGKMEAGILLENTAGQGTNLGWRFEHLAAIRGAVEQPERIGVCIDTCHAFAAGYPLDPKKAYNTTMRELDRVVGLAHVKAFHLNDSKREFGSRVDRHEHIGLGEMGLAPFRHLLNDRRFSKLPMYLETAKEKNDEGEDWDAVNLRVLRELIRK
ncbi:MAG: deoxyribonuclease IV [Pirellulaceae bacterium]